MWGARIEEWLAEEEGQPAAKQHERNADGDIVNPRGRAEERMHHAQQAADTRGRKHAEPRRTGQVGNREAGHGAHNQCAFLADVHAPALLGHVERRAGDPAWRVDLDRGPEVGDELLVDRRAGSPSGGEREHGEDDPYGCATHWVRG